MKFVLNRNLVVASTLGHSIGFTKGEAIYVPPEMYKEVIAVGAVPEEEIPVDEAAAKGAEPTDPAEREAALFEAFRTIVLVNNSADFTAAGNPKESVVNGAVGFRVPAKEREAAWAKFKLSAE